MFKPIILTRKGIVMDTMLDNKARRGSSPNKERRDPSSTTFS